MATQRNRIGINLVLLSIFLEIGINYPKFLEVLRPFSCRESCPVALISDYVMTVPGPQNVELYILRTKDGS